VSRRVRIRVGREAVRRTAAGEGSWSRVPALVGRGKDTYTGQVLRKVTLGGRVWYVCPFNRSDRPPILCRYGKTPVAVRQGGKVVQLARGGSGRWTHRCPICGARFVLLGDEGREPAEFREVPALQVA